MKRILYLSLLLFFVISLSACSNKRISLNSDDSSNYNTTSDENINNNLNNNMLKEQNLDQSILKEYSQAEFETNMGNFTIKLFSDQMPITVSNFLNLANSGYYDGIKFHRVMKDFIIQAGDPLTKDDAQKRYWGTGGPGYSISDEFVEGLSNLKGTIAMANSGPNTGGSQFFINLNDNTYLDFDKQPLTSQHPVFGQVIDGFDIVEKISQVETDYNDCPLEEVIINKINLK